MKRRIRCVDRIRLGTPKEDQQGRAWRLKRAVESQELRAAWIAEGEVGVTFRPVASLTRGGAAVLLRGSPQFLHHDTSASNVRCLILIHTRSRRGEMKIVTRIIRGN
jgi:hypothetical protein